MKKVFAIVLALMLLTASVALAETATVLTLTDPLLTVTQNGETESIDMTGLEVALAAGNAGGEVPTVELNVANGSEVLLSGAMQVQPTGLLVQLDGMSAPLAAEIPSGGEMAASAVAGLFEQLPQMGGLKLPAFTGVDIPKLGLISMVQMLGATGDDSSVTFELPYEMTNMLLSQLMQFKDAVPEEAQQYTSVIFDTIEQMQASNSGFALSGSCVDQGESETLSVDIFPVSEGVTAEASAVTISLTSAQNQINLDVVAHVDGQDTQVADIAITSNPGTPELNFAADVMGMASIAFSLYPQDGAQVAAFEMSAMGQTMLSASMVYGDNEGASYTDFTVDAMSQAVIELFVQTAPDDTGAEVGNLEVTVETPAGESTQNIKLQAGIVKTTEEVSLRSVDAAGAMNVAALSEEDNARIGEELQGVLGNVMNYLATLEPAA